MVGSSPPCLDGAGFRSQVAGFAGLALVLMLSFSGFACAGEQPGNARGEMGDTDSAQASTAGEDTGATHDPAAQAGASANTIGEEEQYRHSCRMQTYIFKEGMSKAEAKDFTARVTYRVQANLNGGDDKDLDDILDDIDVPAYRGLCG